MSHTVHPYVHRLGIIRDWKSRWFGVGEKYKLFLKSDTLIRRYLEKRLRGFYVSDVHIERGRDTARVIIKTSRPGMIIGRSGEGSEKLRKDILKFIEKNKLENPKNFKMDIEEIRSPESDAHIVAFMIIEGLEKRLPFRRVLKQVLDKVMANRDVKGARLVVAGRLGGTDIARSEELKKGQIPLQTFRADIDFAREKAHLPYGDLGIKVWIYKGEVFSDKKRAPSR
ncbi:MAG: 30S ribosomal protein S3 [bacterium]|nr:30S ribosomal protein S3 [bacterium]